MIPNLQDHIAPVNAAIGAEMQSRVMQAREARRMAHERELRRMKLDETIRRVQEAGGQGGMRLSTPMGNFGIESF